MARLDGYFSIGNTQIKSALKQLTGEVGAATYRLNVELEWTPTQNAQLVEGVQLILDGVLEYSLPNHARRPIGPVHFALPVKFPQLPQSQTARVDLGGFVTRPQIEAIEEDRAGGALNLHFKMQGTAMPGITATTQPITTDGVWFELVHDIRAAQWVDVLQQLRYSAGFLIQVPLHGGTTSPRAAEAIDDIQLAIEAINDGRYRDAVAACRDALEVAYGDEDRDRHPELNYKVENLQDAGKEARFWLARRGLWAIAHAAKHRGGGTQEIEWARRDAIAVAEMTAAFLQREPPK